MKKKIISGVVIVIMAIIANYSIYTDLKESAKVAQEAIKSMNTILIAVQSEIISWEEKVFLLQERIDIVQSDFIAETDSLKNQIKTFKTNTIKKAEKTIEKKVKQIVPGLPGF